MIDARSNYSNNGTAQDFVFRARSTAIEAETRKSVRSNEAVEKPSSVPKRSAAPQVDAQLRRVAADIVRSVNSRLPGRVRDLKVRIENDQFVLSGVSSSYYVKQVAQHVAMNALDALMLGRLVNEIEVRSLR